MATCSTTEAFTSLFPLVKVFSLVPAVFLLAACTAPCYIARLRPLCTTVTLRSLKTYALRMVALAGVVLFLRHRNSVRKRRKIVLSAFETFGSLAKFFKCLGEETKVVNFNSRMELESLTKLATLQQHSELSSRDLPGLKRLMHYCSDAMSETSSGQVPDH